MMSELEIERHKENLYIKWVIFHAIIGGAVYVLPVLSKLYAILIIFFGIKYIVSSKNGNNEALLLAAYITGVEVFLRMTHGNFFEQYAKYGVILFLVLGMIFKSFSKKAIPYWIFLLVLFPGVVLSFFTLNFDTDIRKAITFNIVGSVTLFFSALYCYNRKISFHRFLDTLKMMALPLVATLVYMFLYTPSIKDVVTNTESNFETSGGYGPNQVSTILGLGIFVFFTLLILASKSKKLKIVNGVLLLTITFRGIVTFSRGGIITGILMIIVLIIITFLKVSSSAKVKIISFVSIAIISFMAIWFYSSVQTGGLIDKRYANQDARGREKESKLTGRERLIESELNMFLDNPIWGIGVGKNKEYRLETTGIDAASHNEISRLLAEHGMFGIFALLILIFTPFLNYINNQHNIFVIGFVIFWALTINHASMRLAAPAFVYALSLLKVTMNDETTLHREQIK